jgi:hypothetical protein
VLFTEAYRARHRGSRRPPKWRPVQDIGDRAVFVDGAHGFTVTADPAGARANRVYVILARGVTHPCGRLAVAYDVGFSDLVRLECMGRMKLNAGEVERMWGQPHWIIPRDGSDRRQGSICSRTGSYLGMDRIIPSNVYARVYLRKKNHISYVH